jgi:hypothetical protein
MEQNKMKEPENVVEATRPQVKCYFDKVNGK